MIVKIRLNLQRTFMIVTMFIMQATELIVGLKLHSTISNPIPNLQTDDPL
jgi:hypothetical protein